MLPFACGEVYFSDALCQQSRMGVALCASRLALLMRQDVSVQETITNRRVESGRACRATKLYHVSHMYLNYSRACEEELGTGNVQSRYNRESRITNHESRQVPRMYMVINERIRDSIHD